MTISISSGIKQGCPMSGSLWRIVLDPIIRALVELIKEVVKEVGSLSAFADDIGVSVWDMISALLILVPIFGPIEAATCLKLIGRRRTSPTFLNFQFSSLRSRLRRQCHSHLELRSATLLGIFGFWLVLVPGSMHGRLLAGSFSSEPDILRPWGFPLMR